MAVLHDRFTALARDELDRYCEVQQEENLHLDFKTVRSSALKSSDDKQSLAKALSGFANAEGGIVVWGVDARKNDDGVDCAQRLVPAPNVNELLARLNSLTSDLVSPVVEGVLHRVVFRDSDGSGCAASLVPSSDEGPHMAKGGLDHYYRRSGDSFLKMEHFEIADMFGRRPKPSLRIRYSIPRASHGRGSYSLRAVIAIENTGRGTARAPCLAVKVNPPFGVSEWGVDGNGREGLPRLVTREPGFVRYGGSGNDVVHPGTYREVLTVGGDWRPEAALDVRFTYELTAEGIPLTAGEVVIPAAEIESGVTGA
jgi:hypothetical protein